MKHASIVPLIGGETIASEKVFGSRPEYIMSYTPFYNNDRHLLNYYDNEVPYYVIDKGALPTQKVDVVSSVCPCAGLSMLSQGYGDHNENNKWMLETTRFVLGDMQPTVLWGENAPGLAGKIGRNVRTAL
jgi:site-specific DNA-cytosine methylase